MPGLLKDNSDSDNEENSSSPTTRLSSNAQRNNRTGSSSSSGDVADCVSSQEWLVGRYRHLRRELEDVDRQITRLRRNMEQQARRRQQYQHNLERATAALSALDTAARATSSQAEANTL